MTTKKERYDQKVIEVNDLKRLVDILSEIEVICDDTSLEHMLEVAPRVTILLSEADRITKRHKHDLPAEMLDLGQKFFDTFKLYKAVYRAEVDLKNDLNRMIRIEMRKQRRRFNELAAQPHVDTLCAFEGCKKPARVNEYCKRHAREMGIIVRGKIV